MTIARRIFGITAALGVGLLIGGAGVVTAFWNLQRLATSTHEEFHELCDFRKISSHLIQAERHLSNGAMDSADSELQSAMEQLAQFDRFQHESPSEFGAQHNREEEEAIRGVSAAITAARAAIASRETRAASEARAGMEQTHNILNNLMVHTERAVADIHTETARRFTRTIWLVAFTELALFIAAVTISFLLYRRVVDPLRQLRDGTRRLAEGKLDTRLDVRGDREFAELERAFNQMAGELESLCRDLERRVAEKGRELAIAERLASVGFLAAGVAHEINNPLAIMSGYAESLLRTVRQGLTTEGASELVRDLETIRDEAFRCKRITQSLLDLSRLGDEHREPVAMAQVVESCAKLIAAWPASRGVTFDFQPSTSNGAVVLASEPELKQIVLNLLVNAVEATAPTHGNVSLKIGRNNGWVEVAVHDNGKGMTPDTLARVFEPFFSTGKPHSGSGLGLSISHAIARRHGGTLEASSPGPGRGATVVLRLPSFSEHAS